MAIKKSAEPVPVTRRQEQVYWFILEFIKKHGTPPTFREIQGRFKMESTNGVQNHVKALIKKGRLKKVRSKPRDDLLPVVSGACPLCGHCQ